MSSNKCPKCGNQIGWRDRCCTQCGYDPASGRLDKEPATVESSLEDQQLGQSVDQGREAGEHESAEYADVEAFSHTDELPDEEEIAGVSEDLAAVSDEISDMNVDDLLKEVSDDADSDQDEMMADIDSALSEAEEPLEVDSDHTSQTMEPTVSAKDRRRAGTECTQASLQVLSCPNQLVLSVNQNQLYMQGLTGVLHVRVENVSGRQLDSMEVAASGLYVWNKSQQQVPNEYGECQFQLNEIEAAGPFLTKLELNWTQGGDARSCSATYAVGALDNPRNDRDRTSITINEVVNKIVNSGKGDVMGVSMDAKQHLQEQARQGRTENVAHTINDLIDKFNRLDPKWEPLRLSGRGGFSEADQCPINILLLAKTTISIGRKKTNDIVTRLYPNLNPKKNRELADRVSEEELSELNGNWQSSCRISIDKHCQVYLSKDGLFVKDEQQKHLIDGNETSLNGRTVQSQGQRINPESRKLSLAGVLTFSLNCKRFYPENVTDYEESLGVPPGELWDTASSARITALTLERLNNLGRNDENGFESYVVVFRAATIGSDKKRCSIYLPHRGLKPVHAGILYLDGRFYLDNPFDLEDVFVNNRAVTKGSPVPLSFGDALRIAHLEMRFSERAQLYLDLPGNP